MYLTTDFIYPATLTGYVRPDSGHVRMDGREITGMSAAQASSEEWIDAVHPEDRKRAKKQAAQAAAE